MPSDKTRDIRDKLIETRRDLLATLESLQDEQWQSVIYSEGSEWTVHDLLRHLVDSERGMTMLMKQVRKGSEGVPPDFDINRWNDRVIQKAMGKSPDELIGELVEHRPRLLDFVASLEESDWGKKGRHASLRIMSIEEICHLIADHEGTHAADLRKTVAG